ncbi:gamma-butyrobetaine dioxygenase-like [Lytechinus pictus]|uniref:gamma-butyrobetaine dioxygenase-like n=1 Tax=Lytechinus pictus TaxID=7653 RepID=UPI0030B9F877
MNLETKIQDAFLSDDCQILSVEWADGHHGNFPTGWLRGHRFDQSQSGTYPRGISLLLLGVLSIVTAPPVTIDNPPWPGPWSQSDPIADLRPRLWGHDVMATADFSFFDFDEVMENDDALYEWLKVLYGLGMAVLKNAPVETGQHFRLQNRLGYESPTPISSGIVNQVKLNQKSDHPAYSENTLQLHNDMTYYNQAKGYQSFHCIKQATGEGGESLLVDAFNVAEELRHQNQEAFEMLTRIPWEFKLLMGTNYHSARREAIRLNNKGEVCQVTISDICRAAMLRIPPEDVYNAYVALQEFTRMLYHPDYVAQYMLAPGKKLLPCRNIFSLIFIFLRHRITSFSKFLSSA